MRITPFLMLFTLVSFVNSAAGQETKSPRLDCNGDPLPAGAIARLGTTRFQQERHVYANALSPDGTTVAMATSTVKGGTRVDFLDTSTGKTLRTLHLADIDSTRGVFRTDGKCPMQFTQDGKGLVFTNWIGIKVVDVETGKVVKSVDIHYAWKSSVATTKEGHWVALQPPKNKCIYDSPVGIWDTKTGKQVASLPGRGISCQGLEFSPDARRLLLWSEVPTFVDGRMRVIGSDCKVALTCIDINRGKIVGSTTVVGRSHSVALGKDGETVALEADDHQSVRIRHLPTGVDRCVIPVKHSQFVFGQDSRVLFTIDESGRGAMWDVTKGNKIRDLEGTLVSKDFLIIGVSKNDGILAVLDGDWDSTASIVVWNADTGKRVRRPVGHEGTVTCIAYTAGGKLLASGSLDKTVRLWNPATGEHLRKLTVHEEAITAIAISPDGKRLASSSQSGVTRLSNIADGKVVAEWKSLSLGATTLAFSPEGTVLFAGGKSGELLGWEVASAKEILRFNTGQHGGVLAFDDFGTLAVTANGEMPERLQVWNQVKKLPLASISLTDQQGGRIRCDAARFSSDGRILASSQVSFFHDQNCTYGAGQLLLWERTTGQPIRTLAPSITKLLAFSANGRFLAAGAPGESGHHHVVYGSGIDIWDTLTGAKAAALTVTPQCIAFSLDGLHLATGGYDHGVLIWEAPKLLPPTNAKAPSAMECDVWWTALGKDAKNAYKAIGQMVDAPEPTVAFLKERLRPVQLADPDTVAKLIVQLDSENFTEREKAQKELEKMGEGAAHLLVKALQGNVGPESRTRLEELLSKCEETSIVGMQHYRAIATLEWIGTPAARALLRTLSQGAPRARLTMEALAALKRL